MRPRNAIIILIVLFVLFVIFAIFLKNWSDNQRLLELREQQEAIQRQEGEFEKQRRVNEDQRLQMLNNLNQQKSNQVPTKELLNNLTPQKVEDQRLRMLNKLNK